MAGQTQKRHLYTTHEVHQVETCGKRAEDWSLCLKEAFLAAQNELKDFAKREGSDYRRARWVVGFRSWWGVKKRKTHGGQ